MSGANVEASRRVWECFVAGDTDGVLALLDPAIEVHEPPELPGAAVYHGHAGWSEQIARFREAVGQSEYTVLERVDLGDDVVTVVVARMLGTQSGLTGDATYAQLETWRDGRAVSIRYFMNKDAALEAAKRD